MKKMYRVVQKVLGAEVNTPYGPMGGIDNSLTIAVILGWLRK